MIYQIINPHNYVLHIPAEINQFVGNEYHMIDIANKSYGAIKRAVASNRSSLIGANKALSRLGVDDYDLVRFTFNNVDNTVVIEPVPSSIVWDIN